MPEVAVHDPLSGLEAIPSDAGPPPPPVLVNILTSVASKYITRVTFSPPCYRYNSKGNAAIGTRFSRIDAAPALLC